MAKSIPFPEWRPDLSDLGTGITSIVSGVLARADGYGPFKSLVELTDALPSACRGFFFARRSDGSIAAFAGTNKRLYLLDNSLFTWTDVSLGTADYPTLVASDNWQFVQFNDLVIAVNQNTPPQKFTMASATTFVDLLGSPPNARFIAVVGQILVLSGLLSNPRRLQWSDLDAPEEWTAGVGTSDFQDMPDGGSCLSLSGGDAYGLLFQDEAIRSIIFAPGSPTTFQIVRISTQDTVFAHYSVINAGTKTFFLSAQGFKIIESGGKPQPIGKERVDTTFFKDVDKSNLQLCIGATDPTGTRIYWAYKSIHGAAGLFDTILCYDWSIGEQGRWSKLPIMGEYLTSFARPGVTLEQLDAIAPTPLDITGAANNGSGLIRLALAGGLSNSDFDIVGQNFIVVYGVGGTTEANATWRFTVINSTHIDLIGSTFVHAYTSGGHIGGSLDALPFSLDSVSKASVAELAAFSSDHKLGFFTGLNIEAVIETGEQDLEGQLVFVSAARPITDSPDAAVSIGCRIGPQDTVSYTPESSVNNQGLCGFTIETRYARARLRIPAESVWSFATSVQPQVVLAGDT
jgi:hypothetical protein